MTPKCRTDPTPKKKRIRSCKYYRSDGWVLVTCEKPAVCTGFCKRHALAELRALERTAERADAAALRFSIKCNAAGIRL